MVYLKLFENFDQDRIENALDIFRDFIDDYYLEKVTRQGGGVDWSYIDNNSGIYYDIFKSNNLVVIVFTVTDISDEGINTDSNYNSFNLNKFKLMVHDLKTFKQRLESEGYKVSYPNPEDDMEEYYRIVDKMLSNKELVFRIEIYI